MQFKTIDILHNFKNPITAYGLIGENLLKLCNIQQSYSFAVKSKQKKKRELIITLSDAPSPEISTVRCNLYQGKRLESQNNQNPN